MAALGAGKAKSSILRLFSIRVSFQNDETKKGYE
jgi:hypothetical protein